MIGRLRVPGPRPAGDGSPRSIHPLLAHMTPTKQQILAASSLWLAVVLNVVPGLGTGYIYQRRWRAYWITTATSTAWLVLGAVLGQDVDPLLQPDVLQQNQLIGLAGLLLVAGVTAVEAARAAKQAQAET